MLASLKRLWSKPATPVTVFISHSSEDRAYIESDLLPQLEASGIKVWFSPHAIESTDRWESSIKTGLQCSDVFVVLMSPAAAASRWVNAELHWAFAERPHRVVPVMLRSCNPRDCHLLLPTLQHVDISSRPRDAINRLVEAIRKVHSAPPEAAAPRPMTPEERAAAELATPLLRLALACLARQDGVQAVTHANAALEVSQHAGAYYARGLGYFLQKDWPRALEDFTTTIERGPEPALKPLVYAKRARARAQMNDDLRAIVDCDRSLSLDPRNAEALHTRGTLRRRIQEPELALEDFTALIAITPTVDAYTQRGHVHRKLGHFELAKTDFAAVRRIDPRAPIPYDIETNDPRLSEALNTLELVGGLARMEKLEPTAQAKVLRDPEQIGFDKALADLDDILAKVPPERPEHKLATLLRAPVLEATRGR